MSIRHLAREGYYESTCPMSGIPLKEGESVKV